MIAVTQRSTSPSANNYL